MDKGKHVKVGPGGRDYLRGLEGEIVEQSADDRLVYGNGSCGSVRVKFSEESLDNRTPWQKQVWDEVGRGDPDRASQRWVWEKDITVIE